MIKVNFIHLTQLGLSFCMVIEIGDEFCWQFTFKEFSEEDHSHNTMSVVFLKEHGDDLLVKNQRNGIERYEFVEKLMESSLFSNPKIKWVTFHGNSDFGYLIKFCLLEEFYV